MSLDRAGDRCAACGRVDVDEHWLWVSVERLSPDVDCENDEAAVTFCSQRHAADYLGSRELDWSDSEAGRSQGGVALDSFFFGCGLVAIVLSVVGVVAVARWLL